jgi:hypothetical protein
MRIVNRSPWTDESVKLAVAAIIKATKRTEGKPTKKFFPVHLVVTCGQRYSWKCSIHRAGNTKRGWRVRIDLADHASAASLVHVLTGVVGTYGYGFTRFRLDDEATGKIANLLVLKPVEAPPLPPTKQDKLAARLTLAETKRDRAKKVLEDLLMRQMRLEKQIKKTRKLFTLCERNVARLSKLLGAAREETIRGDAAKLSTEDFAERMRRRRESHAPSP